MVEDDMLQALDIATSLEDAGACVIGPILDLDEAIRTVQITPCRAAVLDFRLDRRNTIPLGEELHQRGTPFIIHTGYDCREMLPAQWHGCWVVPKPANIPDLIRAVAALARGKGLLLNKVAACRPKAVRRSAQRT